MISAQAEGECVLERERERVEGKQEEKGNGDERERVERGRFWACFLSLKRGFKSGLRGH